MTNAWPTLGAVGDLPRQLHLGVRGGWSSVRSFPPTVSKRTSPCSLALRLGMWGLHYSTAPGREHADGDDDGKEPACAR